MYERICVRACVIISERMQLSIGSYLCVKYLQTHPQTFNITTAYKMKGKQTDKQAERHEQKKTLLTFPTIRSVVIRSLLTGNQRHEKNTHFSNRKISCDHVSFDSNYSVRESGGQCFTRTAQQMYYFFDFCQQNTCNKLNGAVTCTPSPCSQPRRLYSPAQKLRLPRAPESASRTFKGGHIAAVGVVGVEAWREGDVAQLEDGGHHLQHCTRFLLGETYDAHPVLHTGGRWYGQQGNNGLCGHYLATSTVTKTVTWLMCRC